MVRIISAASLGLGDYGSSFHDSNVDGICYESEGWEESPEEEKETRRKTRPKPKALSVGKTVKTKRGL